MVFGGWGNKKFKFRIITFEEQFKMLIKICEIFLKIQWQIAVLDAC